MSDIFLEYTFNEKKIAFHKDNTILVQTGRGNGSYEDVYSFSARDFGKAVFYYNSINIGNKYKKRLVCWTLNKPILARHIS